jgi:hypothetical protein
LRVISVGDEAAAEIISQMTGVARVENGCCTTFCGKHATHGDVTVVMNAAGPSFMVVNS